MIKSKGEKVYQVVINILLVIVTLCMILPLVLLFMCSITDENTLVANGYSFFPAKFGLSADPMTESVRACPPSAR